MWNVIDALLWAGTGAMVYALYWRGTHTCMVCLDHAFSLNKALGMALF